MWGMPSELVFPATFTEEKWALSDTIHLYERRQLLLDVVIHAQVYWLHWLHPSGL